jgi:hypothetical protein
MFNQEVFVCDWWYNTNCEAAQSFYHLNDHLYQQVIIAFLILKYLIFKANIIFTRERSSKGLLFTLLFFFFLLFLFRIDVSQIKAF